MSDPSGEKPSPPPGQGGGKPGDEPRRNTGPMTFIVIGAGLLFLFMYLNSVALPGVEVPYGFFWKQLKEEQNVKSVEVHGELLSGEWVKIPTKDLPESLRGTLKQEFHVILLPEQGGCKPCC